jgi:ribosomal protein S18 acetylase RimI-like enzyme
MSLNEKKISVVRVGKENYENFCRLIEWRRTGKEQTDLSYNDNENMSNFFEKHNVLASNSFFIYAAEWEGKFVGYINAIIIPKPDPRCGIMYVDELWTPEEYRNNGIASMLMKEVLKVSKELKLWKVRLYVGSSNDTARSFYKKCGYREIDDCRQCEIDVADIEL